MQEYLAHQDKLPNAAATDTASTDATGTADDDAYTATDEDAATESRNTL